MLLEIFNGFIMPQLCISLSNDVANMIFFKLKIQLSKKGSFCWFASNWILIYSQKYEMKTFLLGIICMWCPESQNGSGFFGKLRKIVKVYLESLAYLKYIHITMSKWGYITYKPTPSTHPFPQKSFIQNRKISLTFTNFMTFSLSTYGF